MGHLMSPIPLEGEKAHIDATSREVLRSLVRAWSRTDARRELAIIARYSGGSNVSDSARMAGVTRRTFRRWVDDLIVTLRRSTGMEHLTEEELEELVRGAFVIEPPPTRRTNERGRHQRGGTDTARVS